MCNCISEIQKAIHNKIIEEEPGAIVQDVCMLNSGFDFDKELVQITYNPIAYTISLIKKNGNRSTPRKRKIPFYHTFCPFCGEKIPLK